tara:strand:+ start:121 stop:1248 length:1128 start_codon:yes stop_codon:yes gene_type:complete
MFYCQTCLTPSTRPRIVFNNGICNACNYAKKVNDNIINFDTRKKELEDLIVRIKEKKISNKSNYDCIIPWSGGKDSSAIALHLKEDYGINPLLVRFNALIPTDVGIHNCKELRDYGFDSIEIIPNVKVSKSLSLRFLIERGNPKLHWDAGINAAIYRTAVHTGIPFIFYAEHGETHYGGRVLNKNSERIRDYEEVIENQIGDNPINWTDEKVNTEDLYPYILPRLDELSKLSIEGHYYGYYTKWNVKENFRYVSSKIDFQTTKRGRTYGTFTNYDSLDDYMDDLYYYLNYLKFGYGRGIRDLSRHIQKGEITREEALVLAKKYDGEYPEESIPYILKYLNITEEKLLKILDTHRTKSIWTKNDDKWINNLSNNLK